MQIGLPLTNILKTQPVGCVAEIQRHASILWASVLSLGQGKVSTYRNCQRAQSRPHLLFKRPEVLVFMIP